MEFSSAIYGAIAFFLLLIYYYLLWPLSLNSKHRLPQQPDGAHPFLGHLHLMDGGGSSAQPAHINLAAVADQHGPIFTIRLGIRRAVVVSSWAIAKELFTNHDVALSSRISTRAIKHLTHDFAMFGFSPYGPYWRELRKIVNNELLSTRQLERLSHVFVSEVAQSVKELYTHWEEKKDKSGRALVDMKKWFGELNFNAILRIVVGKRLGSDGDDADGIRRLPGLVKDFFEMAGLFVAADAVPWLGWLDLGGHESRMKRNAKEFDGILRRWLEEHRRRKEEYRKDKTQDFMDVMLSLVRRSDQFESPYDVDTIIKSTCQSMILGGSDTSFVMLTWALSLLLNNRHVLTKALEELDKHVGRDRRVKESDIPNLIYLQAIIKETFRLYPAGPLGVSREFNQDCDIGGYQIPKGTWLIVNIWKLQRDPEVWSGDSWEFKPERFLTTHKDMDVKGQCMKLIPFGVGRRMCPGYNLALHMMYLVLANFLQAFDVVTASDEAIDMTESPGMTNLKPTSLDVLIAPRLSSCLY